MRGRREPSISGAGSSSGSGFSLIAAAAGPHALAADAAADRGGRSCTWPTADSRRAGPRHDQARVVALAGRFVRRPVRVRDQGRECAFDPVAAGGPPCTADRRLLLRAGGRRRPLRPPRCRRSTTTRSRWRSPRWARFHVQRSNLHRIYRWRDGADLIYLGPERPDWTGGSRRPRSCARTRASRRPTGGLSIRGDFGLPTAPASSSNLLEDQARLRLRPGGQRQGRHGSQAPSASRRGAATWSSSASSSRKPRPGRGAGGRAPRPGHGHLQAYLDQEEGRILVFSPGGKQLADLKVAGPQAGRLARASTWPISAATSGWSGCGSADGTASPPGPATRPASTAPTARSSTASRRFELQEGIVIQEENRASRGSPRTRSAASSCRRRDEARDDPRVYQDGSRVSGDLPGSKGGSWPEGARDRGVLSCRSPACAPWWSCGPRQGESAMSRSSWPDSRARDPPGRPLEDGRGPGVSCLVWHPPAARRPARSPRRLGQSSTGSRRPPQAAARQTEPGRVAMAPRFAPGPGRVAAFEAPRPAEEPSPVPPQRRRHPLGDHRHRREGRPVPARRCPPAPSSRTTRSRPSSCAPRQPITASAQQDQAQPPAHPAPDAEGQPAHPPDPLQNGDYLRGSVPMDDKRLRVETRLEEKDLPRDRIARIIWLHPEELERRPRSPRPTARRPGAGRPQRRHPRHVHPRAIRRRHALGQERRARRHAASASARSTSS